MKTYKTVLSIAGSDSSGGAGIQADIKTCCALGVYAMTAITAVTAQNTLGVTHCEAVSPRLLKAQLDVIATDMTVDAVKIGMLPDVASAEIIARFLDTIKVSNVVTDPVMTATSGDRLSEPGVKEALIEQIIPRSTIVTPNINEACALADAKIDTDDDIVTVSRIIARSTGCSAVLIKGGHRHGTDSVTDHLYIASDDSFTNLTHDFIDSTNTHGTGCTLSSAIASFLASGFQMKEAVANASDWVCEAIRQGKDYITGHGHGPLNHLFSNGNYYK